MVEKFTKEAILSFAQELFAQKKRLIAAGGAFAALLTISLISVFAAQAKNPSYMFIDPENISGEIKGMSDKKLLNLSKVMCLYSSFRDVPLAVSILRGEDVTEQVRSMARFSYTFTGDPAAARAMQEEIPTADALYARKGETECDGAHKVVDLDFFLRTIDYYNSLSREERTAVDRAIRRELPSRGLRTAAQ